MILKINNIGMIDSAEIHLKDFTIIAGKNNTGKSTINKVIYALFNSANYIKNSLDQLIYNELKTIKNTLAEFCFQRFEFFNDLKRFHKRSGVNVYDDSFAEELSTLTSFITKLNLDEYKDDKSRIEAGITLLNTFLKTKSYFANNNNKKNITILSHIDGEIKEHKEWAETYLKKFNSYKESFSSLDKKVKFEEEIAKDILKNTFQKTFNSGPIVNLRSNNLGTIEFEDLDKTFNLKIDSSNYWKVSENDFYSEDFVSVFSFILNNKNVTYVESMCDYYDENKYSNLNYRYVRFPNIRKSNVSFIDVYYYTPLEDFLEKLNNNDKNHKIEVPLEETHSKEKKIILEQISSLLGKEYGDYNYKKNTIEVMGYEVPIKNISKGILSLKLLWYMVANDIFAENKIVLLDEVENYLHPEWQVQFCKLLLLIAKKLKCKIVMSTHSPYVLTALSNYSELKKYSVDISYNLLTQQKNGKIINKKLTTSEEIQRLFSSIYDNIWKEVELEDE